MTPRLLMVGTFLQQTGTPGVCDELAARLRTAGWGVRTTSSATRRVSRVADMLSTVMRERNAYDVAQVDVYSGPAFAWADAVTLTLKQLGKPFVLTLHGGSLPEFSSRRPKRVRRVLARAEVVTVPSRYLQEQMQPYHPSLRLLPNPIDLGVFSTATRSALSPKMIWVRSLHRLYDPISAVRVLAAVLPDMPSATLTMVGPDKGDGALAEVLEEADRLGVRERLEISGRLDRAGVAKALAAHDIFLNTTSVDNTPLSVIEALAAGLGVVSTNVGGLPYLLQHERDALLVPFRDVPAMASAVRRLVSDPAFAVRLSRAGRRMAGNFDWKHILPQWEALLTRTAATRATHPDAATSAPPPSAPAA